MPDTGDYCSNQDRLYRFFLYGLKPPAPRIPKEHEFCVVMPLLGNIIPLTSDNQVVMVKQFRLG
jgi:hypothetical protein